MSQTEITIKKAKGRPMLTWVGKKPLTRVRAYPAQAVEAFTDESLPVAAEVDWSDWPDASPQGGLLFHGDNKDVLAHLLANGFRGKVKLIYIDPPFDSGADYVRKVELRGAKGTTKLDGEEYTLGEQIQYTDIWANDNYLQFMYERLQMLKDLLTDDGSLVLHCDYHRSHMLRLIGEEVFGADKLVSEVIWNRSAARGNVKTGFSVAHDTVYFFSKGSPEWHPPKLNYHENYLERFNKKDASGRKYTLDNMISPNPNRPNLDYEWNGVRRVWRVTQEKMRTLDESGRIEYTSNGVARYKRYLDELEGQPLTTIWTDIDPVNSQASNRTGYPTQKPIKLISRIIETTTTSGDLILDCFIGSGSTAEAAQKLGRRWIGCDINKGSIQTTSKRLQSIIRQQAEAAAKQQKKTTQGSLLPEAEDTEKTESQPAQNSFHIYRVNDYDLQIQHNEAVDLVSDHLGITRNRTDSDFDGSLGNKLVKIIPFNHPLSPPDIEEVKRVLTSRPEEERNVVMVCLGTEIAARAAIEQHNKNRPINKLEIIELRTHPKYGGIIKHEPLSAEISVSRDADEVLITINDVLSPSILQRLNKDEGLFRAQITDWRAQVDTVLIDTDYNGEIFNVVHSDVPERKKDLVVGKYRLRSPKKEASIAVKIIDMLGEEFIWVETP